MIVTARTPGVGPEGAADVFVMNADGSNIRAGHEDEALGELGRLGVSLM